MFILIETVIKNNGNYDKPDFGFNVSKSFQNVSFFTTKEEAVATAKAKWREKREDCWGCQWRSIDKDLA